MPGPNVAGFRYQGRKEIPDEDMAAVVVMTDGTLQQLLLDTDTLPEAAVVIIDEIHEMSVNMILLLGCLYLVSA